MQPNELKAVLSVTTEVAMKPVHVEIDVENRRKTRGSQRGTLICPIGLIRARVIQNGYEWTEKRSVAVCGDQEYEIKRKNGVLVEIDPQNLGDRANAFKIKRGNVYVNGSKWAYPHTEVVDGKIHMVTSRKAIFSSWGEYALDLAKREQKAEEDQAKYDALRNPQAALFGMTREEFEKVYMSDGDDRIVYLGAEYIVTEIERDAKGNAIYASDDEYGWQRPIPKTEVGRVEITIDQVNKILSILTPRQKKALRDGKASNA